MIEPAGEPTVLSSVIGRAGERGFAGLVLDGIDIEAAIMAETDSDRLTRAVEIARRGGETTWAERFARRLCELDPGSVQRLQLASILAAAGRCEEARSLLAQTPADEDDAFRRQILGVLHAKEGRAAEAMAVFDTLPGHLQGHHPAPIVPPLVMEMMDQCAIDHTGALMNMLAERFPAHLLIRSLHLRSELYSGDLEKARQLTRPAADSFERASNFEKRTFVDAVADLLELCGWTDELFEYVCDHLARDPTHWSLYGRAASAARSLSRDGAYSRLVAAIPSASRRTAEGLAVLCRWHVDGNRIEEAATLLEDIRPLSAPLYLNAHLYLRMHHREREQVEAAFEDCRTCGIALLGPTLAYAFHTYYYNCSVDGLRNSLAKLELFEHSARTNAPFWQIYLRCLIGVGEEQRAAKCYAALPPGLANGAALKPFDMYFDVRRGSHDKARSGWTRYIQATRHACVNARSSYPSTIALKYSERSGAVLLFATVYNGIDYLDWFLAHYRAAGVDHFFFVDNGSNDGCAERLIAEADVSVFSNSGSFAQSAFGVLWVNHLMQRFGVGHWGFHVDVDEAFVFPDCEGSRSLRDLLSYCDANGYGCVSAIELDIYPERLNGGSGTDPFAESCHFDVDYVTTRAELPPYVMIQGGIRRRLTGLALSMQKTPLVRMASDVRYLECNHGTTHLPVADVTGALLHYKFAGDIKPRFEQAIARGEHFAEAVSYRRLNRAMATLGPNQTLLSSDSRRYEGPNSLARHGLIRGSDLWEAYPRSHT